MHVWTFQTLKLRVYTYLGQSLWWFFMQWQKVEMPCASHSLSVWESERDRESCLLTVVIDQKLWALPELFLLMEALVDRPLNSTGIIHQTNQAGAIMKTLKHSSEATMCCSSCSPQFQRLLTFCLCENYYLIMVRSCGVHIWPPRRRTQQWQ